MYKKIKRMFWMSAFLLCLSTSNILADEAQNTFDLKVSVTFTDLTMIKYATILWNHVLPIIVAAPPEDLNVQIRGNESEEWRTLVDTNKEGN